MELLEKDKSKSDSYQSISPVCLWGMYPKQRMKKFRALFRSPACAGSVVTTESRARLGKLPTSPQDSQTQTKTRTDGKLLRLRQCHRTSSYCRCHPVIMSCTKMTHTATASYAKPRRCRHCTFFHGKQHKQGISLGRTVMLDG